MNVTHSHWPLKSENKIALSDIFHPWLRLISRIVGEEWYGLRKFVFHRTFYQIKKKMLKKLKWITRQKRALTIFNELPYLDDWSFERSPSPHEKNDHSLAFYFPCHVFFLFLYFSWVEVFTFVTIKWLLFTNLFILKLT